MRDNSYKLTLALISSIVFKSKKLNTIKILFFFFLLALAQTSLSSPSHSPQKIKRTALSQTWLNLLHYKKTSSDKFKSLVDGQDFFLSPHGKSDPILELRENIRAFSNDQLTIGREKQHPQCAFPLRYRFVQRELKLSIPPVPCKKLAQFIKKFNLKQISLVFSSAYPNNPGSMFGHTFLRLGHEKKGISPLLDHGLNYSAITPPGEGGVIFAIKGIFGGYRGIFSILPYYAKINQYNNRESRDIWEYQLSMTPEEIETLLLHTWEIETNSYFNYYFFSENCSYHILGLFEVAKPELSLTDYFLYLTPADSVKKLMTVPNLVTDVQFRPSLYRKTYQHYSRLKGRQKDLFENIVQGKNIATATDEKVLDAAISYFNYKKQDKALNHQKQMQLSQILTRRSQLPTTDTPVIYQPSNRPDIGHDPQLLQLSGGFVKGHSFQELRYQTAYHDLLANDRGYEPFSELIFPAVTVRYQHPRWFLEEVNLVSLTSLPPWNRLNHNLSWSLKFRLHQERFSPNCHLQSCLKGHFNTGWGLSHTIFNSHSLLSGIISLDGVMGREWQKDNRLYSKFTALFLTNPWEWYKSKISYSKFYQFYHGLNGFQFPRETITKKVLEWDHSFSLNRNIEIRLSFLNFKEKKTFNQFKISLLLYTM